MHVKCRIEITGIDVAVKEEQRRKNKDEKHLRP